MGNVSVVAFRRPLRGEHEAIRRHLGVHVPGLRRRIVARNDDFAMSQIERPASAHAPDPISRPRLVVVASIGVAQILAWGASYYLPAVFAKPVADATGWPLAWVVGGLSIGLLVSGLISPAVGHLIDRLGGRPILASSAILLGAGLVLLGLAPNLPAFIAAWIVIGAGMGTGLYDPAFSALGRLYGKEARGAITEVTLFGGFSSTVCWPLSAFLVQHFGWRSACLTYAAIQVLLVFPLYLLALPGERAPPRAAPAAVRQHAKAVRPEDRAAFIVLATGLTVAYAIMTIFAVHLLTLLQARGLALSTAVAFGTLLGPSQVGARILEMALARRSHPVWSWLASTVLVAVGLGMLGMAPGLAAAGIVLYGCGSGIRSIVRGTVPLALFGADGYAILMGRIGLPTLLAQAAAPSIGAFLLDRFGPGITLDVLAAAAALNIALALLLIPFARGRPARAGFQPDA
jgi:predicted MFS family arabinose efflux permease